MIFLLKDEILYILESQKGNIVTGGQLASSLEVSRNAIWKAIHTLQDEGNEIISIPNKGYRLMDTNDTLFEKIIRDNLTTSFIGQEIRLLSSINSTNQYLKELDTENINSGFVVIADEQTNGRGRRSRVFFSNKRDGIYLSILLKLDELSQDIRLLTICAAVAVSKAIESLFDIKAEIKWVNDVYCDGKKICGILTEATLSGELQELSTVIIGIGINTGEVAPEVNNIATSIQEVTGQKGIRNKLIAEVLNQFEIIYYDYIENKRKSEIIKYYESRLFIIGKKVLVTSNNNSFEAVVLGIDDSGALIVRENEDIIRHITSGEIKLENY